MVSIIYTAILIASIIFLVRKKEEEESNLALKILGYFLLGSFAFNFNEVSLPLGFIVYLSFFRPTLNVKLKRIAAIIGVVSFMLVYWISPFAIQTWESRPTFVEHELSSVYELNFQNEYERVNQELELENHHAMLENFNVDYLKDGKITDLSWKLIAHDGSSYYVYEVRYETGEGRYRVTHGQLDYWHENNHFIEAFRFFEKLNLLDIKALTDKKGDYPYYVVQSTGERINVGVEANEDHYLIADGEIKPLDNKQLPVEGNYIITYAMKNTYEKRDNQGNIIQENFESEETSYYLFDAVFGEE